MPAERVTRRRKWPWPQNLQKARTWRHQVWQKVVGKEAWTQGLRSAETSLIPGPLTYSRKPGNTTTLPLGGDSPTEKLNQKGSGPWDSGAGERWKRKAAMQTDEDGLQTRSSENMDSGYSQAGDGKFSLEKWNCPSLPSSPKDLQIYSLEGLSMRSPRFIAGHAAGLPTP